MKSYVKIYGPPLLKAIKTLEKLAIDLPEVCIMDTMIASDVDSINYPDGVSNYFAPLGSVSDERCEKLISKSGESLGENDFYFEWFKTPTTDQINEIIVKIDEALAPLGVKYTISTK